MQKLLLELNDRDRIPKRDHLIALLENALLTLQQREQRPIERAAFARTLGAYGEARALERADAYSEVRRLLLGVLGD